MNDRIYLSPPDVGELDRKYLTDAFDSNWIAPLGPAVDEFEKRMTEIVGVRSAAALSSGTAALHLALILAGVEPGDTVLCSDLTFAASANAITYCGASPVFIDADRRSWNLDPGLLEEAIRALTAEGRKPRAVIAVDLYGQCADYERIVPLCERYEIVLIEDAAEALGSSFHQRAAGSFGLMSVLSFNGNKIITTSGGGMLLSDRTDLIERARFLASQARDPAPHYEHSTIGYNYRMSNLLAALGSAQLASLSERVDRRRQIFDRYRAELGDLRGVSFMPEVAGGRSNRWLTTLTVDAGALGVSREDLRIALERDNIEARPVWKPMHMQPVFGDCRFFGQGISERLFLDGLCLPSGSSLTEDDQARVISVIRATAG